MPRSGGWQQPMRPEPSTSYRCASRWCPGGWSSAVDHKPKRTVRLGRLRDIRETGRAVLLVDHYEDDWSQLWWIRVSGAAVVHAVDDPIDGAARAALAAKYHQYRERPPTGPVWSVALDEVRWWSAEPDRGS